MKKSILTFAVLASLVTACSDDAQFDNNTDAQATQGISREDSINRVLDEDGFVVSSRAFAVTCDQFIDGATNVQHSSDTTYVDINNDLLTKLKMESLKAGDVIDVWESVENLPYIRVVDEVTKLDNGMTRCTTHAGDLSMVFEAMEMTFSSTLFSDPTKRAPTTRGGAVCEDQMVSAENAKQFREGKVVHPVVYYERDEKTSKLSHRMAETVVDEMTRAGGRVNILSINRPINWSQSVQDGKLQYGVRDGSFVSNLDVEVYVNINWKWLVWRSYVQEFTTRFIGNASLDLPLYMKGSVEHEWEKSETLAELPSCHKVFMVGCFPVEITIGQSIEFESSLKLEAGMDVELPVHASLSMTAGPHYKNGSWSPLVELNPNFSADFNKMQLQAEGTATAEAGIYYKVSARLYTVAGPTLAIGPKVSAEASAKVQTTGSNVKTEIATTGKIGVEGKVGAEVKLIYWQLGSFEKSFSLYEKEVWNKSATVEGNFINGDFKTQFQ